MTAIAFDKSAPDSTPAPSGSTKAKLWTGRVLSGIAVLFLAWDAAMKLLVLQPVIETNADLGYRTSSILPIGIIELVCLVVYLVPRTAIVGAILWAGYFGGAIATHLRIGNPLFSHTLFPIYVAALLWGGLFLRDSRVRAILLPRPR